MVKLSAIQLTSSTKVEDNLAFIERQLAEIIQVDKPIGLSNEESKHLVVLPECCLFFSGQEHQQLALAKETATKDKLCQALGLLAKKYAVYLLAGTIPKLSSSENKFTNASFLFSPQGEVLGQYDKIHLFDAKVKDNTQSYQESMYTEAGHDVKVIDADFAKVGLSVCFDLRFPVLFQQLKAKGADIITVPSAFTRKTGKAHWQALLQARAIENQVYIIAAGQEGTHENGRETWGHSMIINPWGEIEQCLAEGQGHISVEYRPELIKEVRENMPLVSPL